MDWGSLDRGRVDEETVGGTPAGLANELADGMVTDTGSAGGMVVSGVPSGLRRLNKRASSKIGRRSGR